MLAVPRQLRRHFHAYVTSWLPRAYTRSDRPLAILMPLAAKDVARAGRCIAALRAHVAHPITRIVVPGQDDARVRAFCRDHGLDYRNEKELLPPSILGLAYAPGGYNLNGWIRQQMLKLTAADYLDDDNILAFDSDTLLLRGLSFFQGERQVLFTSDEYQPSYHAMTQRLLGPLRRHPRSFIAHGMLLQRRYLREMTQAIVARHGGELASAIVAQLDRSVAAGLSEYELYGTWLFNRHRDSFVSRYWYNAKAKTIGLDADAPLAARHRRFNSISDHIY